jgi:hypothetical protein
MRVRRGRLVPPASAADFSCSDKASRLANHHNALMISPSRETSARCG